MASESIIAELLRQHFARQNQPDQGLAQIQQIMQGVAQGIQIYDSLKSLPGKYGTPATTKTVTTPGQAGVPTGQPSMIPSIPPTSQNLSALISPLQARATPGFGAFSGLFPQPSVPGTTTIPGQTAQITTPGTIGSVQMDQLVKAASIAKEFTGTGPQNLMAQTLLQAGMKELGTFEPAAKPYFDAATGQLKFTIPKGGAVLPPDVVPAITKEAAIKKGEVAKGTRIIDTGKSGGAGKTIEDKFEDTLKAVEDDARAYASGMSQGPEYTKKGKEAALRKFNETYQNKYIELLNERGTKYPKEMIQEAIETKFGLQFKAQEALDYKSKNPAKVIAFRDRLMALKGAGTTDFSKQRAELLKAGIPEVLIDELIAGVLQAQ